MIRLILPASLALLLVSDVARADIIEIPLPELAGSYVYNPDRGSIDGRTTSFNLGGRVTQVNGAWIRWSGSVAAGWGSLNGGSFRWVSGLTVYLDKRVFGSWRASEQASSPDWERSFDETLALGSFVDDAGWDFLSDGTADVILDVDAAAYLQGEMVAPPRATLDTATLVLDVVLTPVPVAISTWGAIKALYRP